MNTVNTNLRIINDMIDREKKREIKKISDIKSRTLFMHLNGDITTEEYSQIMKKIPSINNNSDYIDEIILNSIQLSEYYSKILDLYQSYNMNEQADCYEENNVEKYFLDFLKQINYEKLFNTIKKKNMIIFPKELDAGAYTLYYGKLSFLVIKYRPDTITLYNSLAHEMGHAIANNVLNNKKGYLAQFTLKSEIYSLLLEKLFLYYLLTNSNIDKEIVIKHITQIEKKYLALIKDAKTCLEIIYNDNIDYSFKGSKLIYTKDDKEKEISMRSNNYTIGNIAAAKIMEEHKYDYDYFAKHLRDMILYIEDLTPEKLIKDFFDIKAFDNMLSKKIKKK